MHIFRVPAAARAAQSLDRGLFSSTLLTAAASVCDNRLLSGYRAKLERTKELLLVDRINPIVVDPDRERAAEGRRCLVLKPAIKPTEPEAWSSFLRDASHRGDLKVVPLHVHIDYSMWPYLDVVKAILPEDLHGEIPVGFNTAGHIAHLNLRDQYMPYRHLIAQVILDKNPGIRTVINKTDKVGTESEFRTFCYEVLAGPDDMLTQVSESGCLFKFDYSKVYWNTKLSTEHQRISSLFRPGEVVADVMAGIGPFAVPAGKKKVFVWANDKNPESYGYLDEAIRRNKVAQFVRPFNQDGHEFIRNAADMVLEASRRGEYAVLEPARNSKSAAQGTRANPVQISIPPTISHFVMNLPACALEFLHNYRGIYYGQEKLFAPHTESKLPMIHAHCFAAKVDDATPLDDICLRINAQLQTRFVPGDAHKEGEVEIHEVRDVAPNKRMFCASFRLPPSLAFASHSREEQI